MEEKKINLNNRLFFLILSLVTASTIYLFILTYITLKYSPTYSPQYFNVTGEGKVYTFPEVAVLKIGLITENYEVTKVVSENSKKMNNILKAIKNLGINQKDIKTTNFSLSPRYEYKEGERIFRGYILNQEITIKIRDFSKIGKVIQLSTDLGANLISDLEFKIDDEEKYKNEAREIAIKKAVKKAKEISKISGLKLKKLVNVSENLYQSPIIPLYKSQPFSALEDSAQGQQSLPPLEIQSGQQEITVSVILTYEVK